MGESVHDEIVEETLEKQVTENEAIDMIAEAKKNNENSDKNKTVEINKVGSMDKDDEVTVKEPKLLTNTDIANEAIKEVTDALEGDKKEDAVPPTPAPSPSIPSNTSTVIPTELKLTVEATPVKKSIEPIKTTNNDAIPIAPIKSPKNNISFSDDDQILDMGTNKKTTVHAPKTEARLDKISKIANMRRKQEDGDEEDGDDEEDFDDDGPLKIGGDNITLDITDIQDISKDLKINKNPILDDIEILA